MRNIAFAAFALCVLWGAGCAPSTRPAASAFGEPVVLEVSQSTTFQDGLHAVLAEINDSRCKPGVVCIWQGELSATVQLSGGSLEEPAEVILGTVTKPEATVGEYGLTLSDITEKAATLHIRKGQ